MTAGQIWKAAVAALAITCLAASAEAQTRQTWRLHGAIEGDAKPFLCADRDAAGLVLSVVLRALQTQGDGDADKASRLFDIAAKLESELCRKPTAEDIVILRCTLDQHTHNGKPLTVVKLSALLRADPSAGEQPFYAWTYAAIEPSDADTATTQEAEKKWCTEETVADTVLEPTPDLVQRVQQRFYDFGFRMAQIDGRLSPDTVQGLIDFQKWAGLPPNGQLTRLTVEKIQATQAPSPWVAIAFDGYGRYGLSRGPTRRAAESDAIKGLRRRSRNDYQVSSVPSPNCIAFATTRYKSRGRINTQAFSGAGPSTIAARRSVTDYCNREKGGGSCKLRDTMCASVASQPQPRFDPGNIPAHTQELPSDRQRFDPGNIPAHAQPPSSNKLRFDPQNLPLNAAGPPSEDNNDGANEPEPELPKPNKSRK